MSVAFRCRFVYPIGMVQGLTEKQEKIMDFLRKYISENDIAPMLSEIAKAMEINTVSTVNEHLSALEKKGYITRFPGVIRGIILNDEHSGTIDVHLLGTVAAGQPIDKCEEDNLIRIPRQVVSEYSPNLYALLVKGDSMIEDGIYDGEVVIVESRNYANDGDLVVAENEVGDVTLKYFYREKDKVRLEPRNKDLQPIYWSDCKILGVLRGLTQVYEYI